MTATAYAPNPGKIELMTTTIETDVLSEVIAAYKKRRDLAKRLADQDLYVGQVVRDARARGASWADMARAVGVSDVAVLKAARRRKDTS